MNVRKLVDFNGKLVEVTGRVIAETGTDYIVDFRHNGVQFRGSWRKGECIPG